MGTPGHEPAKRSFVSPMSRLPRPTSHFGLESYARRHRNVTVEHWTTNMVTKKLLYSWVVHVVLLLAGVEAISTFWSC
jgi:hypothetical protein